MDRDAVLDWLLQKDNPPARLLTLTGLLDQPEMDAEVQDARARLMDYSVTRGILAHSDTFWQPNKRDFWSYKGSHWNEDKGQPSKWITLFALIVLDHFG